MVKANEMYEAADVYIDTDDLDSIAQEIRNVIDSDAISYRVYGELDISWVRPESAKERKRRLDRKAKQAAALEEKERKEYERLSAKYGAVDNNAQA